MACAKALIIEVEKCRRRVHSFTSVLAGTCQKRMWKEEFEGLRCQEG